MNKKPERDDFGFAMLHFPRYTLKQTQILDAIGEKFISGQINLEQALFVKSVFMKEKKHA